MENQERERENGEREMRRGREVGVSYVQNKRSALYEVITPGGVHVRAQDRDTIRVRLEVPMSELEGFGHL